MSDGIIDLAKLQHAKRVLASAPLPSMVTFTSNQIRAMHKLNRPIIERFDVELSIADWRHRFNVPANNPFR